MGEEEGGGEEDPDPRVDRNENGREGSLNDSGGVVPKRDRR